MLDINANQGNVVLQIVPPGETQIFTRSEAHALLPGVVQVTGNAFVELEPIKKQLGALLECDPRTASVSREYERIVRRWIGKIERMGLIARGLWWVDFDTGEGYLCWRYPEIRLDYFHGYEEEVEARRRIDELYPDFTPDWLN